MYERVKLLRGEGLSYTKIQSVLSQWYGFTPSKSSLSEWLREIHHPLGSANRFVAKPTPELAYVIGVRFGDGSINRKGYNRRIRLQSVDRDFVEEFDRCISAILHTRRHTLWSDRKRGEIHVEARSVLLYNFLRQTLNDLKVWIEHCDQCTAAFLRGFFDSEGCVSRDGDLTASNNDTILLGYVKRLLHIRFGIEATGPHPGKREGSRIERRGKIYFRNSTTYYIYVRSASVGEFVRWIGLTIGRKKARLEMTMKAGSPKARGIRFD